MCVFLYFAIRIQLGVEAVAYYSALSHHRRGIVVYRAFKQFFKILEIADFIDVFGYCLRIID